MFDRPIFNEIAPSPLLKGGEVAEWHATAVWWARYEPTPLAFEGEAGRRRNVSPYGHASASRGENLAQVVEYILSVSHQLSRHQRWVQTRLGTEHGRCKSGDRVPPLPPR